MVPSRAADGLALEVVAYQATLCVAVSPDAGAGGVAVPPKPLSRTERGGEGLVYYLGPGPKARIVRRSIHSRGIANPGTQPGCRPAR